MTDRELLNVLAEVCDAAEDANKKDFELFRAYKHEDCTWLCSAIKRAREAIKDAPDDQAEGVLTVDPRPDSLGQIAIRDESGSIYAIVRAGMDRPAAEKRAALIATAPQLAQRLQAHKDALSYLATHAEQEQYEVAVALAEGKLDPRCMDSPG